MFRPFICTCDKRLQTFQRFVDSYCKVKHAMKRPVVYYDGRGQQYLDLIQKLEPEELIVQPPGQDFQYNICHDLPRVMANNYPEEYTLFLEDDIYFSSKFVRAIAIVEQRMKKYPIVDIVTMYGNGRCYCPPEDNNFMYRFSGQEFYGNLALVFKPTLMRWWADNVEKVWEHPVWGWDIKIGQMFEMNGFNWYCTKKHYVQHQKGPSAIDGIAKTVQSRLFVP